MAPLHSHRLARATRLAALAAVLSCVAVRGVASSLPELSPPPASSRFT